MCLRPSVLLPIRTRLWKSMLATSVCHLQILMRARCLFDEFFLLWNFEKFFVAHIVHFINLSNLKKLILKISNALIVLGQTFKSTVSIKNWTDLWLGFASAWLASLWLWTSILYIVYFLLRNTVNKVILHQVKIVTSLFQIWHFTFVLDMCKISITPRTQLLWPGDISVAALAKKQRRDAEREKERERAIKFSELFSPFSALPYWAHIIMRATIMYCQPSPPSSLSLAHSVCLMYK